MAQFTSIVMPILLAKLRDFSVELKFWMILTTILQVRTLELAGRSSHSGYIRVTIPDLWFMMLQLARLEIQPGIIYFHHRVGSDLSSIILSNPPQILSSNTSER